MKRLSCSFALAVCTLAAQNTAPQPEALSLVQLKVVALGDNGAPVTDLKVSDLQIADQGKSQQIVYFRGGQTPFKAAPVPANEVSNRTAPSPHATVILFDLLNESHSDSLDVWHRLGKSLQQLDSGDSLFLYLLTLEGNLEPIHAIGRNADDHTWTKNVEKTLDKAMKAASHARPAQMKDEELVVKKTYVALETLGNQLTMFPGHRDIVWITSIMPNVWNPKTPCSGDWVDCALYVPHMSVTLERDGVAVNPLSYTSSPSPNITRDLEQIAGLSGGWTYADQDIRDVLKDVAASAANSYTVAYEPPAENWDSKFHKVRASTERKGIKLRAETRYYAYPDRRPLASVEQAVLAATYRDPADDSDICMRGSATRGDGTVKVQVRIDPADLLLREDGGQYGGAITLLISNVGASGPIGDPSLRNFAVHLSREQHDAVIKQGLPLTQDQTITPAVQKLRVFVLDQNSNATGSLTIPLAAH